MEKFLASKYPDLPGSKPVERASKKQKKETGRGPTTPEERVDAYLDRGEKLFTPEEKAFSLLKQKIFRTHLTSLDDVPESYWKNYTKRLEERGELGDWEALTPAKQKREQTKHLLVALEDQRASLEEWINYFASQDSEAIPRDIKYWAFRSVLGLSGYDKEKKKIRKRSGGTVDPFPELDPEALAFVVEGIKESLGDEEADFRLDESVLDRKKEQIWTAISKKDFSTLYAFALENIVHIPEHLEKITEGEWRTFPKSRKGLELAGAIAKRGTGWCVAGKGFARNYASRGDFHVYFTLGDNGVPEWPRLAVSMNGTKVYEVRGIAKRQNVEPLLQDILAKKLKELPGGESYARKSKDMAWLTALQQKQRLQEPFTIEDIEFLYEIREDIVSFGQETDPRIKALRRERNWKGDMDTALKNIYDGEDKNHRWMENLFRLYEYTQEDKLWERLAENIQSLEGFSAKALETLLEKLKRGEDISAIQNQCFQALLSNINLFQKPEKKNKEYRIMKPLEDLLKRKGGLTIALETLPEYLEMEPQEVIGGIARGESNAGYQGAMDNRVKTMFEVFYHLRESDKECPAIARLYAHRESFNKDEETEALLEIAWQEALADSKGDNFNALAYAILRFEGHGATQQTFWKKMNTLPKPMCTELVLQNNHRRELIRNMLWRSRVRESLHDALDAQEVVNLLLRIKEYEILDRYLSEATIPEALRLQVAEHMIAAGQEEELLQLNAEVIFPADYGYKIFESQELRYFEDSVINDPSKYGITDHNAFITFIIQKRGTKIFKVLEGNDWKFQGLNEISKSLLRELYRQKGEEDIEKNKAVFEENKLDS